ncbi:threonine-tRNA ligase, cytoplasmic-like isoform X1 [Solea senegalensis]|uniref:threonine--tRNA ligase n=1 Tax=Solea senegalensis TaxID=28829 RepID=A0AAV6PSE7_SOLSE|nr:threonine--tRNA ligase 1, cytoplasmic [Solea senegalensis]KAG7475335.1 threonine-tRNA ligase, cytoplasmic-like isoform X1 [Solea senegalensis]
MAVTQLIRLLVCRPAARATLYAHRSYSKVSPLLAERLHIFESLRERRGSVKRAEASEKTLSIRLAGGQTVKGTAGVTTPLIVAQSARLKGALVSKVNGQLWELGQPLEVDCELQILGFDTEEGKQAAWRTAACVLGAVLEQAFGANVFREGASELGFYCDHLQNNSASSLNDIEDRCKDTAALKLPLSTLELNVEEVRELFQSSKLRLQLVEEQMNGPTVTAYRCGDSIGVCNGPLLPHTGLLKVFKMLQLSPVTLANQTESSGLMRLLGVAFPGVKDKEEWEREQEEARRRDHRRIGTDQDLFFFNDVSPGSCFFLPKGAHIYNKLTDFIKSEYQRRGFTEVMTPTLYSTALWERSGHWEHYSENMFTVTSEGSQTYALKPMNCPAHCLMFEQRVRSWRELPLRWADFGALHRNELSGALGGLTRVRRFCQDDAHIFCTPEQLEEEIVACLDFVRSVYQVFGFSFHCLLSTRPTPCLGEPEQWDSAEQQLERSLQHFGEHWELNPGDGAFYGPKIDIQIKDAIGRQHQCATIQLDFQLPIRFDLQYVGQDGQLHRPVMIHRAVLGSLERMIAILAENFGGKWPLWLSPAQVMVIPIGGSSESYARQVALQFREAGFMADFNEDQGATLNKKIRSAQLAQYNYIFVVGDKESESGTVNVRNRRGKQLGMRTTEEALTSLTQLQDSRSNLEEF